MRSLPRGTGSPGPAYVAALAAWQRDVQADLLGSGERAISSPAPGRSLYREMIVQRCMAMLKRVLPATHIALGYDPFRETVAHHLSVRSSRSFTLAHITNGFADSLAECGAAAWIVELARYEVSRERFRDRTLDTRPAIVPPTRTAEGWLETRFEPAQPYDLLAFGYDVPTLRSAALRRKELPSNPWPHPCQVLLQAGTKAPSAFSMSPSEATLFGALLAGKSLGEALSYTLREHPALDPSSVFDWLKRWFARGLLRPADDTGRPSRVGP